MKYREQILLLVPFLLFTHATYAMTPRVTLVPAVIFDEICSQKMDYQIHKAWRDELNRELPILQKEWNNQGDKLLKETMRITGKPFEATDYRVALSLCNFPSMSDPLIVNMRYSLNSFTRNHLSSAVTISIIYHELLHIYLDEVISKNSSILEKYSNDSQTVKDHLYLFALMKTVYMNLDMQPQLNEIIKKDDSLPNHDYKRTWEIVNANDPSSLD